MKRAGAAVGESEPPPLQRQRTDEPSEPITLVAADGVRVTLSPQAAALSTTLAHVLSHGGDGSSTTEFKTWPPNSGADGTILRLVAQLAEVLAGNDAAEIARAEIKLEILTPSAKLALVRVSNFLNMPRVHEKAVLWASLIFIGSADDVRLRLGHKPLASELASAAFKEPLLSVPPTETSVEESVDDMKVPDLKSELVALGTSDVGKKAELQSRLRAARCSKEADGSDDLETALGGPEGVDAVFAMLDAATLRILKTVSAYCLFEVRRVLSHATSGWRKSPKWTAPKWVRELTFLNGHPRLRGHNTRADWNRIQQLDGAVELPYLAAQLVQLLSAESEDPEKRGSPEALRTIRSMDVSLQAVHISQIMANVTQSIGPGSLSSNYNRDCLQRRLDVAQQLMLQMIELKLEPLELAEAVLLVSSATFTRLDYHNDTCKIEAAEVKKLADQIMRSIMAQPAVLEPHIGALIDWCLDVVTKAPEKEVAAKISLLQQLPAAAFAAHAPKLVTLVCTCTGKEGKEGKYNLADLSFKLCLDKLEAAVRAAAIGAELKQSMQESSEGKLLDKQLRLISLLRGTGINELLPLTGVFVTLLGAESVESCSVAVVASELLCTLPDVAVAPHILEMTALLMKLDDDIEDDDDDMAEAWALRLARALASLSPTLLYTHAEAFVEVRLHHPVTQVRIAAAEIVARAAQSIDA